MIILMELRNPCNHFRIQSKTIMMIPKYIKRVVIDSGPYAIKRLTGNILRPAMVLIIIIMKLYCSASGSLFLK